MTKPNIHIGILLAGRSPETVVAEFGEYDRLFHSLFARREMRFSTYDVVDMEFPEDVKECDGWLITGSKHGVYEDHAFIAPLEDFVRDAYAAAVPMVGICFGHQLIAQAMGGRVEKFKGGWNVGATKYEGALGAFELIAWHQDQVVEKPADAVCLESNDFCENAMLIYGNRAFSMQPHPEFDQTFHEALFRERHVILPEDYAQKVAMQNIGALDRARAADLIENFYRTGQLNSPKEI